MQYAQKKGAVDLVLIDYHNDINQNQTPVTSYNWVGHLIQKGFINQVFWVSGHTMLLPNKNSRLAWLTRNLASYLPEEKERIISMVKICDWNDLKTIRIKKNTVFTIDFDFFVKDGGNHPEQFVKELTHWINGIKPELLTVSLSSTYQKTPFDMWNRFNIFLAEYNVKSSWYVDFESFETTMESLDDKKAWQSWMKDFKKYKSKPYCFGKGSYLWISMPFEVKENLLKKECEPLTSETAGILKAMKENKNMVTASMKDKLITEAFSSLEKTIDSARYDSVDQDALNENAIGVAVRFMNNGIDRGCLSLYRGVQEKDLYDAVKYCAQMAGKDPRYPFIKTNEINELTVNICIFDKWEQMTDAMDFIPGIHSLLLKDENGELTLLQSSIAFERSYSREQFLSRLSNKAGLGLDGWKTKGLTFYKSKTQSFYGYRQI